MANAVPTAEGAVQLAMEQMPVTIHGARVLITGFGRVGQAAARRFAWEPGQRVGARRYEQLALAESEGYGAEQIGGLDGWPAATIWCQHCPCPGTGGDLN